MNRSVLVSGVKRDTFFIILFRGMSVGEAVLLLFLVGPAQGAWGLFRVLMRISHLTLMSNADTFHISMLKSWGPSDGSGTPRESPAKLRKKSAIRDNHEKN